MSITLTLTLTLTLTQSLTLTLTPNLKALISVRREDEKRLKLESSLDAASTGMLRLREELKVPRESQREGVLTLLTLLTLIEGSSGEREGAAAESREHHHVKRSFRGDDD